MLKTITVCFTSSGVDFNFTAHSSGARLLIPYVSMQSSFLITLDNVYIEQIHNGFDSGPAYTADIISAPDYSAFGAPLPGRTFS